MLINKVKLHPFAGFSEKEVSLQKGLNVIHGPNEAGKSTLAKAIQFAFFSPAKLTKKQKEEYGIFFPKTGGDTIRVTIEFVIQDKEYTLKRSWGGTETSYLLGKDIGEITDADTVLNKLSGFLSNNQATWEKILFSHQATLSGTFDNLSDDEIKNPFSDILRGSVATGGVSIDNIKTILQAKIDQQGKNSYFPNWDDTTNRPAGGRDIDNPWKNNVGLILSAYYQWKQTEADLKIRDSYDRQMDDYIKKISETNQKIVKTKEFLDKNKQIVEDANTRKIQEAKRSERQIQLNKLSEDKEAWDGFSSQLPAKQQLFKTLEKEPDKLKEELDIAIQKEGIKERKNKLKQADAITQKIKQLSEELKKKKRVSEKDIDTYKDLKEDIQELNAELKAQKLRFNVKAKGNIDFLLQKGLDEKKKIKLNKGKTSSGDAAGKIYIETGDLILSVESGTENISSIVRKIEVKRSEMEKLNKKYGVTSFKELDELYDERGDIISDIEAQEETLETVLDGDTVEQLKKEIGKIESLSSVRSSKKINEEILEKKSQLKVVESEIKSLAAAISKFERMYRTSKELSDKLISVGIELGEVKKKITQLKPLPPEVKDVDSFIAEYELKKDEQGDLKETMQTLMVEKAGLREPDFTAEELKEKIIAVKNDFELKKKEGRAYKRIYETLNTILAAESGDVFKPFSDKLRTYFSTLTHGKYKEVVVEEVLPTTIKNDDITLPINLLSKGTSDALALAQKLSMAEYYLRKSAGFLLLDDPLTDLDPSRKTAAVNVLCDFAKEKQLIIFTCDPVHAKMFGIKELHLT